MQTKTEIFRDIVDILTNDYAGFSEKRIVNRPNSYVITDDMDEIKFVQTIQSYLLDFKDSHLSFTMKNNTIPFKGFKVRRYQNALYVTEIQGEQRLQIGDAIIALDGLSIDEFEKEHYKILNDTVLERQSWNVGLTFVNLIKVQRDNQLFEMNLKGFKRPSYVPEYSFQQLDPHTIYI